MPTPTFLLYEPRFRDACISIFKSNIPEFFYEHELADFLKYIDADTKDLYWCVLEGEGVVACGGVWVSPEAGIARMCWGLVHQTHHKKGYGRALLEFRLKKLAAMPDVEVVQLDTSQHNPAFFNKFGFTEFSVKKNHYGPGLDSHEMELKLTDDGRRKILGS